MDGGGLFSIVGVAIMALALFLIPLGLPGIWVQIAVLFVARLLGEIGTTVLVSLMLVAFVAELIEWVLVKRMSARYGGSNRAFWGAIGGGILGALVGLPVPVIGSLIAGVLGTFAGAAAVAWWENREFHTATRVGWGAVLGRVFSAGVKTAAGLAILVIGGAALLIS